MIRVNPTIENDTDIQKLERRIVEHKREINKLKGKIAEIREKT